MSKWSSHGHYGHLYLETKSAHLFNNVKNKESQEALALFVKLWWESSLPISLPNSLLTLGKIQLANERLHFQHQHQHTFYNWWVNLKALPWFNNHGQI